MYSTLHWKLLGFLRAKIIFDQAWKCLFCFFYSCSHTHIIQWTAIKSCEHHFKVYFLNLYIIYDVHIWLIWAELEAILVLLRIIRNSNQTAPLIQKCHFQMNYLFFCFGFHVQELHVQMTCDKCEVAIYLFFYLPHYFPLVFQACTEHLSQS